MFYVGLIIRQNVFTLGNAFATSSKQFVEFNKSKKSLKMVKVILCICSSPQFTFKSNIFATNLHEK